MWSARFRQELEQQAPARRSGERELRLEDLFDFQVSGLGLRRQLLAANVSLGLRKYFSQHVVLLIHLHELLKDYAAETLSLRGQASEAIVDGSDQPDFLFDRSRSGRASQD